MVSTRAALLPMYLTPYVFMPFAVAGEGLQTYLGGGSALATATALPYKSSEK